MRRLFLALALVALLSMACAAQATVAVGNIGDYGWYSDDTRASSGADLVGIDYTHAGKPGQTPTAADDAQIANQIQFVNDAPGGVQALKLSFDAGKGGKATFSNINTTDGFATGNWSTGFFANMRRFRDTETNTTIKIGVQSTEWANSQSGFTATRSGESAWDVSLTYVGNYTPFHVWEDVALNSTTGTWRLYSQSGNSYFGSITANKTLADWAADPVWGGRLFGNGAKVTSIMIGAGSFSAASNGYVDYLETNLLNGGERIDFVAVPEPSSIFVLAGAVGSLLAMRRRKA